MASIWITKYGTVRILLSVGGTAARDALFKTQRTPNSVVFLFQVRKRAIFTRFLIRFCDNKLQFWPERLHILNKRGQNYTILSEI